MRLQISPAMKSSRQKITIRVIDGIMYKMTKYQTQDKPILACLKQPFHLFRKKVSMLLTLNIIRINGIRIMVRPSTIQNSVTF